jgi:glycosyltransferase involved in cell wall biosynthesis
MKGMTISVCMLIQAYYPVVGGAERQLQQVAAHLRDNGVRVTVLTRPLPGTAPFEVIEGTPVYRIPSPGSNKTIRSLTFTLNALTFLTRRHREIDLFHAHDILSPTTVAALAGRIWHKPVVVKVLNSGTDANSELIRLRHKLFGPQRMRYYRAHIDAFVCINSQIAQDLSTLGIPQDRLHFIPNGVDSAYFHSPTMTERAAVRRRLRLDGRPVAVFVGRLVKLKQVNLLLQAWARIPDGQLLLVGDGPERAALEALSRELGLGDRVRFCGMVHDVRDYLQASDLFVLPSRFEGLSNALLEAMSCGLPAVTTRVGAAPELLETPGAGLVVGSEDIDELRGALRWLLDNPMLRQRMGTQARKLVEANYPLQHTARRLAHLYQQLLDRYSKKAR